VQSVEPQEGALRVTSSSVIKIAKDLNEDEAFDTQNETALEPK
jgi:hypothetical protein